jgi:hypothetical protein|tara:strand:- start:165 stop:554 length:390 start_codon:yes stop_codon:yes gene_type:complete
MDNVDDLAKSMGKEIVKQFKKNKPKNTAVCCAEHTHSEESDPEVYTSKNKLLWEIKHQGKNKIERGPVKSLHLDKSDKVDVLINLLNKNNDKQEKKINQMMGMINDLHEGVARLEKKVDNDHKGSLIQT